MECIPFQSFLRYVSVFIFQIEDRSGRGTPESADDGLRELADAHASPSILSAEEHHLKRHWLMLQTHSRITTHTRIHTHITNTHISTHIRTQAQIRTHICTRVHTRTDGRTDRQVLPVGCSE